METASSKHLGYSVDDFTNNTTGTNYLRSLFISHNILNASGVYVPLFLYPENGYLVELPKASDDTLLDAFYDIVNE